MIKLCSVWTAIVASAVAYEQNIKYQFSRWGRSRERIEEKVVDDPMSFGRKFHAMCAALEKERHP